GWILWSSNDEFSRRQFSCRSREQLFDLGLAVRRIRSHVAEIADKSRIGGQRFIFCRIDRAVQRRRMTGSEAAFQFLKHRPTGEAEVEVEQRDLLAQQIRRAAGFAKR